MWPAHNTKTALTCCDVDLCTLDHSVTAERQPEVSIVISQVTHYKVGGAVPGCLPMAISILICASVRCSHGCAGCSPNNKAPAQGDVRLIALDDILPTQPCDAVHFGGVEIFNNGQWGRICSDRSGRSNRDFTIDANVVCKQLGFPFGTLYDAAEVLDSIGEPAGTDYIDVSAPGELVWATDVLCTGKEERLDECFFPEDFEDARLGDYAPEVEGIRRASCRRQDGSVLGVVCRRFEIEGVQRQHLRVVGTRCC